MLRIQLEDLLFEEWPSNRDDCYLIGHRGLDGWFEGVDIRRESVDRPLGHGKFDMPGFLTDRVVTIKGHVFAPSLVELEHKVARLRGVLRSGSKGRLIVETEFRTEWCDVRLQGRVNAVLLDDTTASYQIQVWSPDPRKYGQRREFKGSRVVVSHRGNDDASQLVQVNGSRSGGYIISGPDGKRVAITRTLNTSSPHLIDFETGAFYVAGVRETGGISRFEPWTVPPGSLGVAMAVSDGLTLTVKVDDTSV